MCLELSRVSQDQLTMLLQERTYTRRHKRVAGALLADELIDFIVRSFEFIHLRTSKSDERTSIFGTLLAKRELDEPAKESRVRNVDDSEARDGELAVAVAEQGTGEAVSSEAYCGGQDVQLAGETARVGSCVVFHRITVRATCS